MSPEMRFISIFNLTIIALGTLSNLFTLSICLRKRLRTAPTFVFIAFNAFIETIPLYVRNLDNALQVVFGWFLRDKWWFACRVTLFFHYFPLQTSAWLLVSKFKFCFYVIVFASLSYFKGNIKYRSIFEY